MKRYRRCRSCRTVFIRSREHCPECGLFATTSWRHKVIVLGIVTLLLALLYWVIVRYLVPPHGAVGAVGAVVTPRW